MSSKATAGKDKSKSKTGTDLIRRVTWDRVVAKKKKALPDFQTGDTVGVYVKVKEGEKERVQLYSGVVIKVQGSGIGRIVGFRRKTRQLLVGVSRFKIFRIPHSKVHG